MLFIDIVGYSKLVTRRAAAITRTLNQIVREAEQFRAAEAKGRLITVADRRWDGAGLLQHSGSAGGMRAGDQQALRSEHPELQAADGNP